MRLPVRNENVSVVREDTVRRLELARPVPLPPPRDRSPRERTATTTITTTTAVAAAAAVVFNAGRENKVAVAVPRDDVEAAVEEGDVGARERRRVRRSPRALLNRTLRVVSEKDV